MSFSKLFSLSFFSAVGAAIYAMYHIVVVLYGVKINPSLFEQFFLLFINVAVLSFLASLMVIPLSFLPIQQVNQKWLGFVNGYIFSFALARYFDSDLVLAMGLYGLCAIGLSMYTVFCTLKQKFMMGTVLFLSFGSVGAMTAYVPTKPKYGKLQKNSPNVLVIVIESLRYDHLSSNGHPYVNTDGIDQLIETGVSLDNFYVQGTNTFDLYDQLLLGKDPWDKTPKHETLANHFRSLGYRTGAFVGSDSLKGKYVDGFNVYDDDFAWIQGLTNSVAGKLIQTVIALDSKNRLAEYSRKNLTDWLLEESARPFFVLLQFDDPNWPFSPPSPWREDYFSANPSERKEGSLNEIPLTSEQKKALGGITDLAFVKAQYAGEIAYVSRQIEFLIKALKDNEMYQNTCVVLVGSHGMSFGEQQKWFSVEASPDSSLFHVPLVFAFPGILPSGTRVSGLMEGGDIVPTIMEVLVQDSYAREGLVNVLYGSEGRLFSRGQVLYSSSSPRLFYNGNHFWLNDQGNLTSDGPIDNPNKLRTWMQFIK